jgi:hypothetical protein
VAPKKLSTDRQDMRDYLLGTLPPDRQTVLEERILGDQGVYEELMAVEDELIDQYVAGSLSKLEQHRFETHFLITPERQKKLGFGRLLKRYLNDRPAAAPQETAVNFPTRPLHSRQSFFGTFGRSPLLGFSIVVVVCVGLAVLGWLLIKSPLIDRARGPAQQTIVVTLAPGAMRSGGAIQHVSAPPKGTDLKLELEVAGAGFRDYEAQLFREREHLQTRPGLKAEPRGEHHVVPVTIEGEILTPGDYQLKLTGVMDSGQTELIDRYSFRVTD